MRKLGKSPLRFGLAIVVLLIFFHYVGFLAFFEQAIIKLSLPLQQTFYNWGSSFNKIVHLNDLSQENQRLQDELARLSIDYIKLASLESENEYLRSELNYLKQENYQYQLANIVSRLPFNDQIVIIDQGTLKGLKEGLAVTVSQGVIVGKVLKVEENMSYVELLSSIQSNLAVSLSQFSGTNGLIKGKAGISLLMDFIPQDQEVKKGDLVISSGLEEQIPKGLLVGEVSEVISQLGQIFKQAKVISPFNYQNLQTLTIILPN